MKKVKLIQVFCLSVVLVVLTIFSVTTFAGSIDTEMDQVEAWDMDEIEAILSVIDDTKSAKESCEIRIYNENNELVKFGHENCDFLCMILRKSDFLTEIDGVKYYRLYNL